MAKNSKPTRNIGRVTPAKRKALPALLSSVRNAAVARNDAVAHIRNVLGTKPSIALYRIVRETVLTGYLCTFLGIEPKDAQTVLTNAGHDAKKLADGQGRRTKAQEVAYGNARVAMSRLMKAADVANPEARGGDTSQTRAPKASAKAKAAISVRAATPKVANAEAGAKWISEEAARLVAFRSKNTKALTLGQRNALEGAAKLLKDAK